MNFLRNVSILNWQRQFQNIAVRFPLTLLSALASCISLIYLNHFLHNGPPMGGREFFILFYPLTAMPLSLTLNLWTEDMQNKRKGWLIQGIGHCLWLALCIYWATEYQLTIGQAIAAGTCVGTILIGWFTLPFVKQYNDRPAINFLIKLIGSFLLATLTSLALYLGILLLIQSFIYLFGIDIKDTLYADTAGFCFALIAPILVLIQLPEGEQKYSQHNWLQHKFGNGIIHYLLIPLHFAYVITLYLYAAKILITWQLPNGWVASLVSVLMLLTIIIVFLLYPTHQQPHAKPFDRFVIRYLPVIVLPLLVLMSIGIVRRFTDYGLTIQRLYLALFNIWCYAVCIGLFVYRTRKVIWVAWSFAAILALVSVFPFNIADYTKRHLQKEVKLLLAEQNITELPMNSKTFIKMLNEASYDKAKSIAGKLNYLRYTYEKEDVADIINPKYLITDFQIDNMFEKADKHTASALSKENMLISEQDKENHPQTIPQGYRYYLHSDNDIAQKDMSIKGDTLYLTIRYRFNDKELTDNYRMSLADIEQKVNAKEKFSLAFQGKQTQLIMMSLYLSYGKQYINLVYQGTLFIK